MDINQYSNNQELLNTNDGQQVSRTGLSGLGKLTWSALGLSAMLALSACSGDKAAEEPVVDAEAPVVVVEEPVVVVEEPAPAEEAVPVVETPEAPADDVAVVEAGAEPEVLAADAGEQLYNTQCMACHQNGLLNAPKLGDKEAWAPRIAKGKDTLHMHSAKGFNQMPAQASADVSEAKVYAAVDYMIAAAS